MNGRFEHDERTPDDARRSTFLVPLCIGVLGVLAATPGVHLFELWMSPLPAKLVSHGIAIVLLTLAVVRWRRRAREV